MLKVCKFGGSSLAGAAEFVRVRDLVAADVARRVVVVSAPGRRHPDDQKITDLLYLCHAHLRYGVPCWELWRRVCDRFLAIRDGCGLQMPLEQELESIYASLNSRTEEDFLASRGEYLAARLMAELLGFAFVDAAEWLRFDYDGQVREEESYALLASLAVNWKIDWYDTGYDIEQKRRIVKTALNIRRTMGTAGAARTQADAIYPGTKLEEWFEYGGTHGKFRLRVNITTVEERQKFAAMTIAEIERRLAAAKRFSAHLEEVEYYDAGGTATAYGIAAMAGAAVVDFGSASKF